MWFSILKRIYSGYDYDDEEEKKIDYTAEFDDKSFTWEDGEAHCSFYVFKNEITITYFTVGYENRGKKLGETFFKKFIKEAEEKFNRKFKIIIQGPTEHGLPFWKRMKRKGLIDEWY
jgi:hypothetical protein|tara:strand:- start:57 stop:407 length:351 start_codon:yes stop_codon:yes gene_type:complete